MCENDLENHVESHSCCKFRANDLIPHIIGADQILTLTLTDACASAINIFFINININIQISLKQKNHTYRIA